MCTVPKNLYKKFLLGKSSWGKRGLTPLVPKLLTNYSFYGIDLYKTRMYVMVKEN